LSRELVKKGIMTLKETVTNPININEDGHTDVPSSMRMCMTIIEDAQDILEELRQGEMDKSIDTWWTNKLAVSASSLNKLRDYITNKIQD
jgi:hypothetical protein